MKQKLRYSKYLKERKGQYLILLLAYLCVIITQLLIPQLVSKMLSGITAGGAGIWTLTVWMLCLIAVEAIGTHCFGHFNYKLSNELLVAAEKDSLQQMLRISYQKISGADSSYLGQRMNNDLVYIMDFYVEKVPLLAFKAIQGIVILILLFRVSFYVGIFAVAGIGIYAAIYFLTRKRYYQLNEAHRKEQFSFVAVVCKKLARVLTIKLNSWYQATQRDFQAAGEKLVKVAVKYLDFDNFTSNMSNVTGRALVPALLLGLYFTSTQNGGASQVENFAMALLYMQQLIAVVQYIVQGGKFYETYKVSCDMMDQLLAMPKEQCGERILQEVHAVELQNVTFSYGEKNILKRFSYKFEKGKVYALCGENGTGKSTLFLLMMGILQPEAGEVLWDGQQVSEINMEELRKGMVGFVNQEPLLMEGTISDNLFYGREEAKKSADELSRYALLDFVAEKDQGYETQVNSQSSNLSGGQKQRIAIVRALLKETQVLCFDEPTSALDSDGILLFTEMLQQIKEDKIVIVITHDRQIREACDEVVTLQ